MARILVVEDYPEVVELLCSMLDEGGHETECVRTYAEAFRALLSSDYDLIVADVRLPDGNAYELMDFAAGRRIKMLFITGHFEEIENLRNRQCTYLVKPFTAHDLLAHVEGAFTKT